jgi:hypothetical protein
MKKLIALSLIASLAACSEPDGSETADLAPDAVSGDVTNDDIIGDGDSAPDMETVSAALGEACPTLRNTVSMSMCRANGLGQSFTCDFAFESDPEGTERELTIAQEGDGWTVESEPEFCDSLDRAAAMADEPADVSVDTEPTD